MSPCDLMYNVRIIFTTHTCFQPFSPVYNVRQTRIFVQNNTPAINTYRSIQRTRYNNNICYVVFFWSTRNLFTYHTYPTLITVWNFFFLSIPTAQ